MTHINDLIDRATEQREALVSKLRDEKTDCYRLFHGIVEGKPGLTIDQYGPIVLAQTFREPLEASELESLLERYGDSLVYNHRGSKEERFSYHTPAAEALEPQTVRELDLLYSVTARHRGKDPHLFLDLRVGRRWLLERCASKSVLNLFAYSCGLGQVAVAGGASEVWNVDFSESGLQLGRKNLALNSLSDEGVRMIAEDFFPVIWQLSGVGLRGKKARRRYVKLKERRFDFVLLDPPARAKGSFQMVDLVNDYQSLFKPALLTCAKDGCVMATNNVAAVSREAFGELLTRCAEKAGRPLKNLYWLTPDEDFPSFDGQHPLKIAICKV